MNGTQRQRSGQQRVRFVFLAAFVLALIPGQRPAVAAEVVVASGSPEERPRQPQVAIAAEGTVHLVYGVADAVYHTQSNDGGQTFSPPSLAFRCPNMSLGMRRGPRLAVVKGDVVVTAIGGALGKGKDGDIRTWRRSAAGDWSEAAHVNNVESSAREGLHNMAAGPDGTLWCTWLDLRRKGTELAAAFSRDGGKTWSPNQVVYRSPDGSVCECCHPSVAVDSQDGVHILFRNQLDGQRDMFVASSKDAMTFSPAQALSEKTWTLKACPMDGGMLAVGGDDRVWSAYRRQDQVFLAVDGRETLLGRGEQPTVARHGKGVVVLWTQGRLGDLMVQIGDGAPRKLAAQARDPVVVSNPAGDRTIAVWESMADGAPQIRAVLIPD